MKKIFYLLLIFSLSICFTGCSSDDDDNTEKVDKSKLQSEYSRLLYDITEYQKQVDLKQAEHDAAKGGRQLVLREQLIPMLAKLDEMKAKKRELERQLGI